MRWVPKCHDGHLSDVRAPVALGLLVCRAARGGSVMKVKECGPRDVSGGIQLLGFGAGDLSKSLVSDAER